MQVNFKGPSNKTDPHNVVFCFLFLGMYTRGRLSNRVRVTANTVFAHHICHMSPLEDLGQDGKSVQCRLKDYVAKKRTSVEDRGPVSVAMIGLKRK